MQTHVPVPAGWYIDPDDGSRWRYWDGAQWTEHRHEVRPAGPPAKAPKTAEARRRMRIWGGIFAALLAVAVVIGVIEGPAKTSQTTLNGYAQTACELAARGRLRAPSTAKFPLEATVSNAGDEYSVLTYVDSQNGFGAQLRSSVRCTVTHLTSTKQWRVDAVSVG